MDHEGNGLRIKIKVRNGSNDDGKKQVCSIGHMRIHSETTMEKGLLFQPSTPAAATRRSSSSSSFSSSSSAVVDCSISLPSWSLTGQRGRKSTSTTAAAAAATTTTVPISDVLPGAKRMKIETHLDNEKLPKRKVHSEENKNEVMEKEYKCSKVFSSRRAFGGHKSSHYKANKTDTATTNKTTANTTTIGTTFEPLSLDSSTDQTAGLKRVMDFDLNQLPTVYKEAILESCILHL